MTSLKSLQTKLNLEIIALFSDIKKVNSGAETTLSTRSLQSDRSKTIFICNIYGDVGATPKKYVLGRKVLGMQLIPVRSIQPYNHITKIADNMA